MADTRPATHSFCFSVEHYVLRKRVHGKGFLSKCFALCLGVVLVLAVLAPLFAAGTFSLGAANKVCGDRREAIFLERKLNNPDRPELDIDDDASYRLLPQYLWNLLAATTSSLSFIAWIFFTPHSSLMALELDVKCKFLGPGSDPGLLRVWGRSIYAFSFLSLQKKPVGAFQPCAEPILFSCPVYLQNTVGSFFVVNFLANILVITFNVSTCAQTESAATFLGLIYLLSQLGLNLVGTNLLFHRYLLEKASSIVQL